MQSGPAQRLPTRRRPSGLSVNDACQECAPAAGSLPFTEFLYETDSIADGNQNRFNARIGGDCVVDRTDRSDVPIIRKITDDVAALERVVQQDQASWRQAGQHLFVVPIFTAHVAPMAGTSISISTA